MRSALGIFAVFSIVVAGLMLALNLLAPNLLPARDDQARFVYLLLWLGLIGGGVLSSYRANMGVALRQALVWLAIFLLVVLGYSYRDDAKGVWARLQGELLPAKPVEQRSTSGTIVALRKADDGHYHAQGVVNGTKVDFLVDTGASSVALSPQDARRAGLHPDKLQYSIPINTANGRTWGAPVTLESVSIGAIRIRNVQAIVIKDGLDGSLLGMSFLGRLRKFEASQNQLILHR